MNINQNSVVLLNELDKYRCAFCGDHFHVLRECEDAKKEMNRLYNASVYHRNYAIRNQDEPYLWKWFASLKIVELQLLFLKINPNLYQRRFESTPQKGEFFKSVTGNLVEELSAERIEFFNGIKSKPDIQIYYSGKMNKKLQEIKIKNCMDFFYYKYPEEFNY
jgi:hypothetical protein